VSERVIDAVIIEERVVACLRCGRKNRLCRHSDTGVYRCGICRAAIANPFTGRPAMGITGYVVAAILALAVVVGILAALSHPRLSLDQAVARKPPEMASPVPDALPTTVPVNDQIIFDYILGSTSKGQLTVINGSSHHAVAKLIDVQTDTKILSFAICAGNQSTVQAIPDGAYNVLFAFGDRLYVGTDRFESPRGFSKFDRPFTFTTSTTATDTEDATYYRTLYSTLSVTLTPVSNGNITTSSISRTDFERY
jgi:hypothetical protein